MSLLSTENLAKEYGQRRVVDGVSINVTSGEIVGLLGPNGAGKTTTFNMIIGVVRPDEGAVVFQQNEITSLPMHLRARAGVGRVPLGPWIGVFRRPLGGAVALRRGVRGRRHVGGSGCRYQGDSFNHPVTKT